MSRGAAVEGGNAFGHRLRAFRVARRRSQRDLAEALGVDASYISRVETGRIAPPEGFADRVKGPLGLSQDEYMELVRLSPSQRTMSGLADPVQIPASLLQIQALLASRFSPRLLQQFGVDPDEKNAVGHFLALEIVGQADAQRSNPVILDSGSANAFLAYHLSLIAPPALLDVFTPNLLAALYLLDRGTVYLLGGRVDQQFGATMGSESVDNLRSVCEYLDEFGKDRVSRPIGVLASLAFTPADGPFARTVDLPTQARLSLANLARHQDRNGRSRHMQIKETMIGAVADLIVPLSSEKLIRSELPLWQKIAAPVDSQGKTAWRARLAGVKPKEARTHVVLALPVDVSDRERVLRTAAQLLTDDVYPFTLVQTLFGRLDSVPSSSRLLTVFDMRHGRPLSVGEAQRAVAGLDRGSSQG